MFSALAQNQHDLKSKVNLFVALSPVTNISHTTSGFLKDLSNKVDKFQWWADFLGIHEIFGADWVLVSKIFCLRFSDFCNSDFYQAMQTRDYELKDPNSVSYFDRLIANSASYKQFIHYGQIIDRDRFQEYDYKNEDKKLNLLHHGSNNIPEIRVEDIQDVPILLLGGTQDDIATKEDVERLA
mmetsp:Transcript_10825/g.18131  ORF Transcript_10825/g.18131 Transcript_10825/m.18131 type:complete len:183 (+) Transcript_10825:97-645(+)